MQRRGLVVVLSLLVGTTSAVTADDGNLADAIPDFFEEGIHLDPALGHEPHFLDPAAAVTFDQLNSAIAAQFANRAPGSATGGFTFIFDPAVGSLQRSSDTFGPIFAERATTVGKGKFNVGVAYFHQDFDAVDGIALDSGNLSVPLTHEDEDNSGDNTTFFYEGDIIDSQLYLNLSLDTTLVYANYGFNDRLDFGLGIPFVQANLDGRVHATIEELSTAGVVVVHRFEQGALVKDFALGGKESGIGDVAIRGKFLVYSRPEKKTGVSVALDVRLPTGNEDDLLGTGATRIRAYGVASTAWWRTYPHLNLGYTVSSGGGRFDIPDELDYTLGFDAALHPKVTLSADLIGRTLFDAETVSSTTRTLSFNTQPDINQPPILDSVVRQDLAIHTDDVSLLMGALGVKFNPGGNFLVVAGVLAALKDSGLVDDLSLAVGLEWSF